MKKYIDLALPLANPNEEAATAQQKVYGLTKKE